MATEIPAFCDFGCPHAAFPPAETAGICRTMAAVQCTKLHELVNKNAPCEYRRRHATDPDEGRAGRRPNSRRSKH